MTNDRYIFRFTGDDTSHQMNEQLNAIHSTEGVTVVDDSMAPKMLLVEAPKAVIHQLRGQLSDWAISPEINYKLPDARKRVQGRDEGGSK